MRKGIEECEFQFDSVLKFIEIDFNNSIEMNTEELYTMIKERENKKKREYSVFSIYIFSNIYSNYLSSKLLEKFHACNKKKIFINQNIILL